MILLQVTSISTDHELPLGKFFRTDTREHFTIKALATDIENEGEYVDDNGVVWSVSFDEMPLDFIQKNTHLQHVTMTSVRPLKELKLEMTYN